MRQVMMLSVKKLLAVYLPALLIALLFVTPFIVSDQLYNGVIVAKEFWFFGVVAAMLLYSGIRLLFKKGGIQISLNLTDILLLAFYTWCFIRAIFTPYTPFWHNHKLQVLTGMMVVYFFVKNVIKNERNEENENNEEIENIENNEENENNERNEKIEKKGILSLFHSFILSLNSPSFFNFLIFSFVLSGFLQAIYGLLQLYGIYPSHHNLFKITGSFFNPAPYALYLAVVFPIALGKVLFNEKNEKNERNEKIEKRDILSLFHSFIHSLNFSSLNFSSFISSFFHSFITSLTYYLSFATVIAILLVLPATMIRASWLGTIAGSLVVLQFKYHYLQIIKQFLNNPFRRIVAVILTIIVVALVGYGLYYLKKDSANGKLFIWEVTLGKIAEKPLFGHGLGRFEAEYNNWQAEYFKKHPEEVDGTKGNVAGNTKYAFNEFLEMASEVGIIGLLLFIAAIGSLFYFIPSFLHSFIVLDVSSLISLLFCAVISFPFYSISLLVLLFILIGIITIHHKAILVLIAHQSPMRLSLAVLLIIFSISQLSILRKLPSYCKWKEANYFYEMLAYSEANSTYKEIIPSLTYEGVLLQQYGKSLQMNGNNKEAAIFLEKAGLYTSDYILYAALGDAYKGTGQYAKAETAFQQATCMEPNKLYPRYLLAKLYDESGQRQKAIETAAGLLSKDIKVHSTAIEEIKTEMENILSKYYKQ